MAHSGKCFFTQILHNGTYNFGSPPAVAGEKSPLPPFHKGGLGGFEIPQGSRGKAEFPRSLYMGTFLLPRFTIPYDLPIKGLFFA